MYDVAGNITQDNLGQQYTYDAEGRIATEGSTTYKYDAEGQLVYENGSHGTQVFLRNLAGQATYIYNPAGCCTPYAALEAYIDGEKIGSWQHDTFHFTGQDGLATKRYESDGYGDISSGTTPFTQASFTSLPFGDMLSSIGTDPTHFTGKERDLESGLDYFGARHYSSSTGRFMSPDPSGLAFADPTNPQSFNLYSYVLNNPLSYVDPTGMYCDYSDHNDPAGGFDQTQFDYDSSSGECAKNAGIWVNDAYTHGGIDDPNRPHEAISAISTPPAPGTNLLFDQEVAADVQYLQQQKTLDAPTALQYLQAVKQATGAIPNVCDFGASVVIGPGRVSLGVSADTKNGVRPAGGLGLANKSGAGVSATLFGGAEGNVSYGSDP